MLYFHGTSGHKSFLCIYYTELKPRFSIKDFFSKCDQIEENKRISHVFNSTVEKGGGGGEGR